MKNRNLFFDIVRIIAIFAIVLYHVPVIPMVFEVSGNYINLGYLGFIVMIFISGCVIAYTTPTISTKGDAIRFFKKRIVRLYPAIILSIIFTAILTRAFYFPDTIFEAAGLSGLLIPFSIKMINGPLWFIGVLLVCYLLYPVLSKLTSVSWIVTIFALGIVQSTFYYETMHHFNLLWFVMVFAAGIVVVQQEWYPKTTHQNETVAFLSDYTFFIYLINFPIITFLWYKPAYLIQSLTGLWYPWELSHIPIFLFDLWIVAIVGYCIMQFDNKIQRILSTHLF